MTESIIRKWIIVPAMGLIWLLALLYNTGIGQTYNVYELSRWAVVVLTVGGLLLRGYLRFIPLNVFLIASYVIVVTIITAFFNGHHMLDYIWLYGITYLLSRLSVREKPMRMVSVLYGLLGMAVLFVWNYGSAFSGWNTNSIAMIAFFSFAVMIVSFNRTRRIGIFFILAVYLVLYFSWTDSLRSRSGVFFTVIMILCIYRVIPAYQWLKNRRGIMILLLIPLFAAVFVVLIRNQSFVDGLDAWSRTTFGKSIFNGRDIIWYRGFEEWLQFPLWGNGNLSAANWHNSAVTMLVGGGAIGYVIWIRVNRSMLARGIRFLDDSITFGLMLAFISIWLQQTVELGLVAGQANAIPYAILGLLLGRVRTLEREYADQTVDHSPGL